MIPWLPADDPHAEFPPLEQALVHPNGLLCAGGDLSPARLLRAYRHGLFPWYSDGEPILWWSPDPRMVIEPREVYVSRRLERTVTGPRFALSMDHCFGEVMRRCADPRPGQPGTWITGEMLDAYQELHRLGHAHSLEVWEGDTLAGGIYGIAIGAVFFGESMFHRSRDASKVALVCLCRLLQHHGFELLDCQVSSGHLYRMGGKTIPRADFQRRLERLCQQPNVEGDWLSVPRSVQLAPVLGR